MFMVLVGFPLLSMIVGIAGYYLFKNIIISPLVVFLVTLVATFTVFNDSFMVWVFVYTCLAFLSGFVVNIFKENRGAI
ncbi:YbeF family protein [Rossellomorea aquimaris]|uniref:YbeF family protein n=1 Tax=Rossellomorea aquimaris TaxID=189382 RepID=UPI0021CCBE5C|nr:YbeF family protein [Rossellomorea aquimaris]